MPPDADNPDPVRVAPPADKVARIEVIVPAGLAGAVRAVPVLRGLRDAYPDAILAVRGHDHGAELLHLAAWVDTPEGEPSYGPDTFTIDLRKPGSGAGDGLDEIARHGGWQAAFRGDDSERRYLIHARWEAASSSADNMLRLGWLAGGRDRRHAPAMVSAPGVARHRAARLLRRHDRPIMALHPFSADPARAWPQELALATARLAVQLGLGIVLVGDDADRGAAGRLTELLTVPVTDITGVTDVPTLLAVLERADLVVGAWSGPAMLASAIGTPTIIAGPIRREDREVGRMRTRYVLPPRCPECGASGRCEHRQPSAQELSAETLLGELSLVARRVTGGWRRAGGSTAT